MIEDLERRLAAGPPAAAGTRAAEAARRVARGAAEAGLLDVAYARVDSPLGPLLVAGTERGLVRLAYLSEGEDAVLDALAARLSPRVLEAPERLDPVRRALDEYFEGRRSDVDVPLDWSLTSGFARRVLQRTARIPVGQTLTYREVAAGAGSPAGSRAAGNALGSNPIPIVVPCHRVVRSGGALGGYTGGVERKVFLLRLEGVPLP
jgi:methylated-DNA-[protein]-cysteine S-methyltransferase